MAPRSLCGNFLTNKRSLVAFTWTVTTVLTLVAVMLAVVLCAHVHAHYIRMEHYYSELLDYQQQQREYYKQQQQDEGDENQQAWHSSDDQQLEMQLQLGAVGSSSMAAVAAYTVFLALALSLYGSTTIVGFTSMRGVYIAPCFSPTGGHPTMKIGLFGGAIIFFANLLLVSAIVLGEVRVSWRRFPAKCCPIFCLGNNLAHPLLVFLHSSAVFVRSKIGRSMMETTMRIMITMGTTMETTIMGITMLTVSEKGWNHMRLRGSPRSWQSRACCLLQSTSSLQYYYSSTLGTPQISNSWKKNKEMSANITTPTFCPLSASSTVLQAFRRHKDSHLLDYEDLPPQFQEVQLN